MQMKGMADDLLRLIRLVIAGKTGPVGRLLDSTPSLAVTAAGEGATRAGSRAFFFTSIRHYLYQGDSALHMAAAAYRPEIVELLIAHGADVHARNRHGATPLHYAADLNRQDPVAQSKTIRSLISAGADPNAMSRLGVTPLHRAVRTRSSTAVTALLNGGADARKKNGSGSTPLHLAVQTTGKGGSSSERAREEQATIIRVLLDAGAKISDRDGRGRSVQDAAAKGARPLLEPA
jgi:ankyrin repeat protein